jgi:hypothetical protein
MPGPKPPPLALTARQRALLERWVRGPSRPQGLVRRARIILEAGAGANNAEIGRRVGCHPQMAQLWRGRWLEAGEELYRFQLEMILLECGGLCRRPRRSRDFCTPEETISN